METHMEKKQHKNYLDQQKTAQKDLLNNQKQTICKKYTIPVCCLVLIYSSFRGWRKEKNEETLPLKKEIKRLKRSLKKVFMYLLHIEHIYCISILSITRFVID